MYRTSRILEFLFYVVFRFFNNLRLINDEAWFDSRPRLRLVAEETTRQNAERNAGTLASGTQVPPMNLIDR